MDHHKEIGKQRKRRQFRVRKGLKGTADRPRLTIHRTLKHVYCQVIDDAAGRTIAAASTRDTDVLASGSYGGNQEAAKAVGAAIAAKAVAAGIQQVCFDRGRYRYHGRIAAVADAVREAGISF